MAKFHINPVTGKAGGCSASKGSCPFGGPSEHFASEAEAMANYETVMAGMTIPEPTSREVAREAAIASFESRIITDQETYFALEEDLSQPDSVYAEGTMADLATTLPPGDYTAYYDDLDERQTAIITIDEHGGVLAVRQQDPATAAAETLGNAGLVEAARQAENLAGENSVSTPVTEAWLEDGNDEVEEVTSSNAWLMASTETRRLEAKVRAAAGEMESAESGSMAQIEAIDEYESAVQTLESTRQAEVRAKEAWSSAVEVKRKAAVSVADTLNMYGSMAEDEGDEDAAENFRAYASEVMAYARFADWNTPTATGEVAKGLRDLQDGLGLTERRADSWSPAYEYYAQASGAFEPLLDGFSDITE